jgi:hypothetical protein
MDRTFIAPKQNFNSLKKPPFETMAGAASGHF